MYAMKKQFTNTPEVSKGQQIDLELEKLLF